MAKKMSGRLVALSASAVATIYLAGLLSTRPAAESVAAASNGVDSAVAATPSSSLGSSASDSTSVPVVVVGASTAAAPTVFSTSVPAAATSTATTSSRTYATGTYSGTGTSRFGNVSVSVTTAGGKIATVQITRVTTSYPVSRIASLPAQVIQNQTASVNVVSGATYSSQAFKQAVQQALAQALAANSTTSIG